MKSLILFCLCAIGCSHIHYVRTYADGSTLDVVGDELGVDKALSGFKYQTGDTNIGIDSLDQNQTNGLAAITEAVVKGAIKGVAP